MEVETVVLWINLICFILPLIVTTIKPIPHQIESTKHARNNNWSLPVILVTRALPYLTLYTQFWNLLAWYHKAPILIDISLSLSIAVFLLYHGINLLNPMHLSYHPEELVRKVVSWRPPMSKEVGLWLGLQIQHSFSPFYNFYLIYTNEITNAHVGLPVRSLCCTLVLFIYVIWLLICWKINDIPPYPFLKELREKDLEKLFYVCSLVAFGCLNFIILF